MKRLAVALLALTLLAAPLAAAQPAGRVPRIAIVLGITPVSQMLGPDPVQPYVRAFRQGLRDLGYVDGQNIVIERRAAEGKLDRLPEIFAELVQAKVDVIVVATTPVVQAAKRPPVRPRSSSRPGPIRSGSDSRRVSPDRAAMSLECPTMGIQ